MTPEPDSPHRRRRWARAATIGLAALLGLAAGCGATTTTEPAGWDLRSEPNGSTLALAVFLGSSSCRTYGGTTVVEDDEAVTVRAVTRVVGDDGCSADMVIRTVDVALTRPLGDRRLEGCRPEGGPGHGPGGGELSGGCREVVPLP